MLPLIENLIALPPEDLTRSLLAEPESQWFDRKSARIHGAELAKTLVAMANAEGGMIAIGLSNGVCEGVGGHPANQNEWLQSGLDFTVPPVRFERHTLECVNRRGMADQLFVLVVSPGEQVHANIGMKCFCELATRIVGWTLSRGFSCAMTAAIPPLRKL